MTVISKTLELGPNEKRKLQPLNNKGVDSYEITAVVTEMDVGLRFEGSSGNRSSMTAMNSEELQTRIFIDKDTNIIIDSNRNGRATVFLSIKTV